MYCIKSYLDLNDVFLHNSNKSNFLIVAFLNNALPRIVHSGY